MIESDTHKKAVACAFIEALGKDPFEFAKMPMTEDFVDHTAVSDAGTGMGRSPRLPATYRDALPDLRIEVEEAVCEGEKVAVRYVVSGTHTGSLGRVPPTGRSVEVWGVEVLTIRAGKVAERRGFFDALGMMSQIGALLTPEELAWRQSASEGPVGGAREVTWSGTEGAEQ